MKHLVSYLALRTVVGLIGLLPATVARALGRGYGLLWHLFDGRRRRMAHRHMTRVLGPGADIKTAARSLFKSYGRYWAEALWVRARRVPKMLEQTRIDGLDRLITARDEGKGMVFALPHMGNWEAAAPAAVQVGVPVVAVAENLPNRRITDWFTRMRAEFGIEIVLATGNRQVMRSLEAALAANKAVALPSDRDLKGKGIEVEFFGERTTLPPGPATLAIRTGAPLLPVASWFDPKGYHLVVHPPIQIPQQGTRNEKVAAMTQELARHFEEFIKQTPEQWHLLAPNWPSDLDDQ